MLLIPLEGVYAPVCECVSVGAHLYGQTSITKQLLLSSFDLTLDFDLLDCFQSGPHSPDCLTEAGTYQSLSVSHKQHTTPTGAVTGPVYS